MTERDLAVALVEVVRESLQDGTAVELDGLGTFVPDGSGGMHFIPEDRPRVGFPRLPFLRRGEQAAKGPILGFAGMWLMLDEAHITTIGVAPEHRGKALGEMIFVNLMDEALRRRARWMTLEVRVSNTAALGLYAKYGFTQQGLRKRYYSDNGEDAYIMWSESLRDPGYRRRLEDLRRSALVRLGGVGLELAE